MPASEPAPTAGRWRRRARSRTRRPPPPSPRARPASGDPEASASSARAGGRHPGCRRAGTPRRSRSAVRSSRGGVGGRTRLRNIREQSAPRRQGVTVRPSSASWRARLPEAAMGQDANRAGTLLMMAGAWATSRPAMARSMTALGCPGGVRRCAAGPRPRCRAAHRGVAGIDALRGDRALHPASPDRSGRTADGIRAGSGRSRGGGQP